MTENTRTLLDLADKRTLLQAAWYRQILTLAAGGLALLVGLAPQVPPHGAARYFLAAAWVLLGAGILSGAAATYAEVNLAKKLQVAFQSQLRQSAREGKSLPGGVPIVARPHAFFRLCQTVMILSLLAAVLCVVCFAVLRTLG